MRKKSHIPFLERIILHFLINHRHPETIMSDYDEGFQNVLKEKGFFRSRIWLLTQIFSCIPPFVKNSFYWSSIMFRNYMKTALRNVQRHRAFSIINVSGLTIGIACFILIMLYVQFEFSYDNFHEKRDRIFRIYMHWESLTYMSSNYYAVTAAPMAPALKEEFPEVVKAVRIKNDDESLISYGEKSFYETGIFADEDFVDIFSFDFLSGDINSALTEPNSIIISDKIASKYFNDEEPLGKILKYNENIDLIVKGVLADIPENSHLKFEYIISFLTLDKTLNRTIDRWGSQSYYTYIELNEDCDYKEFEKKLPGFMGNYKGDSNGTMTFLLQPLYDIHLRSYFNFDPAETSDIKYIYMFSIVAFVIMIIACINYMNLSTAQGIKRTAEIGIRKVVGACRKQLISQFMGETFMLTIIAGATAVCSVYLILPYFNSFIGKELMLNISANISNVIWIFCIILFVAVVSGSYSSLFLSSFTPIKVIKGKLKSGSSHHRFRSILVIFQFCITIFLIGGTTIVYKQMKYIKNKDMGFDREHILVVPVEDSLVKKSYNSIKNELSNNHNIIEISSSGSLPYNFTNRNIAQFEREDGQFSQLPYFGGYIDSNFINLFGLRLTEGRDFSLNIPEDISKGFIVSELLVEQMGWEAPLGKLVRIDNIEGEVIGVIRNFHHYSLHHEIKPVVMRYIKRNSWIQYISVKIRPENIEDSIELISNTIAQYSLNHPFSYFFMDDAFNDLYKSDQKLGKIFRIFTLLAILISCLGLFGLVSFIAEQKRKEIGIRKALGASAAKLISILSVEFLKYAVIAGLIALPAAYYIMNSWLKNFTYRIEPGIEIFVFSAGLGVLISMMTVGYKSIMSAVSNPVDSLRDE